MLVDIVRVTVKRRKADKRKYWRGRGRLGDRRRRRRMGREISVDKSGG